MGLEKAKLTFMINETGKQQKVTVREQVKQQMRQQIMQNYADQRKKLLGEGGLGNLNDIMKQYIKSNTEMNYELARVDSQANKLSYGIGSDKSKVLEFQFNPSTLRISAFGGGMSPIQNFAKQSDRASGRQNAIADAKSAIQYGPIETHITVDFKVIFDAERNTDAFMADKLNILNSPVKTVTDIVSKDVFSVRQIVEGFIVLVRNHETRMVTFNWGPLSYSGTMNSVQCVYTMFNLSGEPIRAEVSISILTNQRSGSLDAWASKYETGYNIIKKGVSDSSNIANNLINLQF